jgi:hypothetical protein
MKSASADKDKPWSDGRLDELAGLLALGISRALARDLAAKGGESSTGLCAGIERVLGQDNNP